LLSFLRSKGGEDSDEREWKFKSIRASWFTYKVHQDSFTCDFCLFSLLFLRRVQRFSDEEVAFPIPQEFENLEPAAGQKTQQKVLLVFILLCFVIAFGIVFVHMMSR